MIREQRKWTIKDFKKIEQLKKTGFDWNEVGEYFNKTAHSVKQFYYRNGENRRKGYPRLSEERKGEIKRLKNKGLPYSQIAAQMNTTKNAIAGAIWRHKL